jgi:hypothetical protein
MKKNIHLSILLFGTIFSFLTPELNGQTEGLIKTTEYSGALKRRDMFLNKDMNVVQESYYSEETKQIVNTIYYDNNGKLIRIIGYENYPKITFDVDFSKGSYEIPKNKTILKFKNKFVFDGLQKGDNIVVNYSNGIRQGRLIQTDSAEYGTKTVVSQRPNVALLRRFNILQFYNEIGEEETYKVYKGLILNFSNNQLNGRQLGYYVNGTPKIKANFLSGKVLNYSSFSQEGSTLSNIVADSNALVKKPYILNGVIEREKLNVSFKNVILQNTGTINFEQDYEKDDLGWQYESQRVDNFGDGKRNDSNGNEDKVRTRYLHGIIRDAYFEPTYTMGERNYDGKLENFYEIFNKRNIDLKKLFDDKKLMVIRNNPHVLRVLFGIPFFNIRRFDFENKDQTDLEMVGSVNGILLNEYTDTYKLGPIYYADGPGTENDFKAFKEVIIKVKEGKLVISFNNNLTEESILEAENIGDNFTTKIRGYETSIIFFRSGGKISSIAVSIYKHKTRNATTTLVILKGEKKVENSSIKSSSSSNISKQEVSEKDEKSTDEKPNGGQKELEAFFNSVIDGIKSANPNYELPDRFKFDNWINSPFNLDELTALEDMWFRALVNKKSSVQIKQESAIQFAKIYILLSKNQIENELNPKRSEISEFIAMTLLNMGHSYLVLSNIYQNKFLFEVALNLYSRVPMEYSFSFYDNLTTEKIIQKDWKELIRSNMFDKDYVKEIDLKNLKKE